MNIMEMPIYIGKWPDCDCITAACVDDPAHIKDTTKFVRDLIKSGRILERLTPEQWEKRKETFRRCIHRPRDQTRNGPNKGKKK